MNKPLAVLFYGAGPTFFFGWGGWITSLGIWLLARRLRAMGIEARCYSFDDRSVYGDLVLAFNQRRPLLGYAYSLGNTALTYYQSRIPFRLVFCIAMSELAGHNNEPISKRNTKNSTLWRGPGILSDALVKGFDRVKFSNNPHLTIDFDQQISDDAIEQTKLALGIK